MTDLQLDPQHGQVLLRLARDAIRRQLERRGPPEIDEPSSPLADSRGVFVTLHRAGTLRGCLGRVEPSTPLWIGVRDMAVAAATRDKRFDSVRLAEVDDLHLEISVLSPLVKLPDPEAAPQSIEVGRHGIYLRREDRTGLLLPQVAVEHGWKAEQFLDRTCAKAGLPEGAWREGVEVFVFSCQIFAQPPDHPPKPDA